MDFAFDSQLNSPHDVTRLFSHPFNDDHEPVALEDRQLATANQFPESSHPDCPRSHLPVESVSCRKQGIENAEPTFHSDADVLIQPLRHLYQFLCMGTKLVATLILQLFFFQVTVAVWIAIRIEQAKKKPIAMADDMCFPNDDYVQSTNRAGDDRMQPPQIGSL